MRWQKVIALSFIGVIAVGCSLQGLDDYEVLPAEVAGPKIEADASASADGSTPEGAPTCLGADGLYVSVGQSEPCDQNEDGSPVSYGEARNDDKADGGVPDGGAIPDGGTTPTPLGICHRGTHECLPSGTFSACKGAVGRADRDCSSTTDNDCNGTPDIDECKGCTKVDETEAKLGDEIACFDGFPAYARAGKGPCKAGTKKCEVSPDKRTRRWSACAGAVGPTSLNATKDSTCNATSDENCNGTVKEGCDCTTGDKKSCGNCSHTQITCTGGKWPACPAPSADTWNGIGVGGTCSVGTGACNRTGSVYCPGSGGDAQCSVSAGAPGSRQCSSSADNDCNGYADNTEGACKCDGWYTVGQGRGCTCSGSQTCMANGSSVYWTSCPSLPTYYNQCGCSYASNYGQACIAGCGTRNCGGACTGTYGYASTMFSANLEFSCCWIDQVRYPHESACGAGYVMDGCTVTKTQGGGYVGIEFQDDPGSSACRCQIRERNIGTDGAQYHVSVRRKPICNP